MSFHLYLAVYTTTILVVLTCTLNVSCQDTRDRVRLLRLKLLAVKMRAKVQALDGTDSYISKRSGLQRRLDEALNNFEKGYMTFHQHLTLFINALDNTYRRDLPFDRQKMIDAFKRIPQILPLNDESFAFQDTKKLILKWNDLSRTAQRYLKLLPSIIKPEKAPGIRTYISQLRTELDMVKSYATQLSVINKELPKALPPGIGGANLSPPLPYVCDLCKNINQELKKFEK
ncbi:uncharacterized protein LOC131953941 [Physella acuta]|uniref:uncharacterized protein LOC131953941 n=1 Tax=Physella acuta TaxID=109671 RepID=UPI0027DB136A|nr:uncharacterized protein LOC131953941 [Physella acuta]